jgi:hypothetical protein
MAERTTGLARTHLGERTEPKRRPDLVNRDLGDGTDAEVLERRRNTSRFRSVGTLELPLG